MRTSQVGHRFHHLADSVDVTLHEMSAEAIGEPHRALEVQRGARLRCRAGWCASSVSSLTSASHQSAPMRHHREAAPVDRDGVAESDVVEHHRARRCAVAAPSKASTVPISSTMPVNMCASPFCRLPGNGCTATRTTRARRWRRDRIAL